MPMVWKNGANTKTSILCASNKELWRFGVAMCRRLIIKALPEDFGVIFLLCFLRFGQDYSKQKARLMWCWSPHPPYLWALPVIYCPGSNERLLFLKFGIYGRSRP